jgi:hypothetical protein
MRIDTKSAATYTDHFANANQPGAGQKFSDTRESIAAITDPTAQQAKLDSLSSDHLLHMATKQWGPDASDAEKQVSKMAAQTLLDRHQTTFDGSDETVALTAIASGAAPTDADTQFGKANMQKVKDEFSAALDTNNPGNKDAAKSLLANHQDFFSADTDTELQSIADTGNQV